MACNELAGVAAEVALGVLTGRERARALIHLDQCGDCREHVQDLAITAEQLLVLLPARDPPPGFETRLMHRFGPTGHRRRPPAPAR